MSKRLVPWLLLSVFSMGAMPQPLPGPGLQALTRSCPTPDDLADFLSRNLTFLTDKELFGLEDYWQAPEEMLKLRQGDCEDYALLAEAVLQRQGTEAFVFSLYGQEKYAHTICVFLEDGRYNVINQDRLVRCRAGSLEEVADLLCPEWHWGAIARRYGSRGRAIQRVERKAPKAG